MKPLNIRLQNARKKSGIPWDILERDYLLSWILAGISQVDILKETLAFKGGTALKKCYFGDYRFSEDLDFSTIGNAPTGDVMEQAMQAVCMAASRQLDEYAPVEILCQRYLEKQPHPGGQEAFSVRAQLPWHRQPQIRVIVEISIDEKVLRPVEKRKIIHEYSEPLNTHVMVYSLEEIVAEKLRAILQHVQRLEERGWSRSRARDYYDLWRILGTFKRQLNLSDFRTLLDKKCALRNVSFHNSEDFFHHGMITYIEKTWQQWLGPLVPVLPSFDIVLAELRPQIAALLEC